MRDRATWEGTATELLDNLELVSDERTKKAKAWPKSVQWLTRKMKRSTTFLREVGIEIVFPADGANPRIITIRQVVQNVTDIAGVAETAPNLR